MPVVFISYAAHLECAYDGRSEGKRIRLYFRHVLRVSVGKGVGAELHKRNLRLCGG